MIEDLKGDESWRMFRIISEFTEGVDRLSNLGYAISIFGSARLSMENQYCKQAVEIAKRLAKEEFSTEIMGERLVQLYSTIADARTNASE